MIGFLVRGWTSATAEEFSDAGWGALVLTGVFALLAGWLVPSWVDKNTAVFLMLGASVQLIVTLALARLKQQDRQR